MKAAYAILLVMLAAGVSAAAAAGDAADDDRVPAAATVQPQAAEPTAGLADIPENAAERDAIRRGELTPLTAAALPPLPATDAAREARRVAYDAVIAEQDARIEALASQLTGSDGEQSLALQKQIEREKAATGRRLLELQLEFARADGDLDRVERVRAALAAWDAPAPVGTPVERPEPANSNR